MRGGRATLVCLTLAALSGGCQTFHPTTPLTVVVRDAETHEPIPEATVRLWRFGSHSEEHDQKFTTGPDGTATPRVAPPDDGGVMVDVTVPGYLPIAPISLPHDVVDALSSAKPFHPYKGPPLSITVETFAGPRPKAELVIPSSYRGLVKAEIRPRADGPWPARQREFTYTLPPDSNGVIRLDGPMVFGLPSGPEIVAKFADGRPIPTPPDVKNADVAFRWVRKNGSDLYFVVGTSVDAETARRQLGANDIDSGPAPKKSDGGGGGRGGGGRGGRGGRGGGMGGGGMGGP